MSSVILKEVRMVTREYEGLAGAGGVKDVVQQLSEALIRAGIKVTVFMPRYGFMEPSAMDFRPMDVKFEIDMNYAHEERREGISLWHNSINGVDIHLIESGRFAEKKGVYTYTEEEEAVNPLFKKGDGHLDYFAMNTLLQKASLLFDLWAEQPTPLFHCHDGHAAVLPAMMHELEGLRQFFKKSATLVTIHNAGIGYHQDVQDIPFAKANTGLPWRVINNSLLHGSFDPFLAGAQYGPVNTVSENYARELQETEIDATTGWLGHSLKDRGITIEGITNGIDPDRYDPKHPERLGLPAAFDPLNGELEGKKVCRRELIARINNNDIGSCSLHGLIDNGVDLPLITSVSRLTEQKGMDCFAAALEELILTTDEFRCVVLGNGAPDIEARLKSIAENPDMKGKMALLLGYDEMMANLVYASGDFFVIPSRYEPCGLTDFIAQLFGNLPIARETGGLVKTKDGFNGFTYKEFSPIALKNTLVRAIRLWKDEPSAIEEMQKNGIMNIYENYTWDKVVKKYMLLYEKAVYQKNQEMSG